MNVHRILAVAALACAGTGVAGAQQRDTTPVATRLVAEPTALTLKAGDVGELKLTANDATGKALPGARFRISAPRTALELAGGQNPSLEFNQLPGLVGVVIKEGDPVRIWTKVGAVGMPLITDPRRLMVSTVLS